MTLDVENERVVDVETTHGPRRLMVMRHAESASAIAQRISGAPATDAGLTPAGIEQARALSRRLAGVRLDLCITTEFPRTQHTARLALDGRDVPTDVLAALNDPRLGDFEGAPVDDFLAWLASVEAAQAPPGGGESQLDAVRRYERAWRAVLSRPAAAILVVAHAFPISVALTLERGKPPLFRRNYDIPVGHAEPHDVDVDALRRGLDALRAELSSLDVP